MHTILITGANGLLGHYLVKSMLADGSCRVIALGRGACRLPFNHKRLLYYTADITHEQQVQAVIEKEKPDIVVHAAAVTQVDECAQHPAHCEAVNIQATTSLLQAASSCCSHFIYISTDFVFDGKKGQYRETDSANPISHYGFTKQQAEILVEVAALPFAIVRTCLVYGRVPAGGRSNLLSWVKQSLEAGKAIKVVDDQWRTPTYAGDLARGILLIIRKKAKGIFHISGKDRLTPYAMALQTAAYCDLDASLIEKTDAGSFSQPGRRPLLTGFDISRARQELGYEPLGFAEGLKQTMEENWDIG